MENIIEPTSSFDFSHLKLLLPSPIQNYFFSKISYKNNPFYIKCPKCSTKQGIVKTHKKMNTDLMFEIIETELMDWIEHLEQMCIELISKQSSVWFEEPLEKQDIENAFIPSLKLYKSGKFYLLHVNIKPNIKVYNEEDSIVSLEEINNNSLLSIIEIQGIRFNNKNFQIEMELKQCMIIQPDPFLDNCFTKTPITKERKLIFNKDETEDIETSYFLPQPSEVKEEIKEEVKEVVKEDLEDSEDLEELGDLEELEIEDLEDLEELKEVENLGEIKEDEPIKLKKPDEVYWNMYQKALEKAKELKRQAIESYLTAKNIKELYNLEEIELQEDLDELNKF
jgi:hypothetical protein